MAIYKKRISLGTFLRKGEDLKDGDMIQIMNEGKSIEGQFGAQDIFLAKTASGKEGNVTLNSTSINNMIDAFGEDSKNWIGKPVKVWLIRSNVKGKMVPVLYISHPEAILNDEGIFVLSGTEEEKKNDEIPVIEDEEEVDPKDIPF